MTGRGRARLRRYLTLDSDNAWLAGVCAGAARALRTDPVLVRTGFVVCGLFMPRVVLAVYLVAWLLLLDPADGARRKGG